MGKGRPAAPKDLTDGGTLACTSASSSIGVVGTDGGASASSTLGEVDAAPDTAGAIVEMLLKEVLSVAGAVP